MQYHSAFVTDSICDISLYLLYNHINSWELFGYLSLTFEMTQAEYLIFFAVEILYHDDDELYQPRKLLKHSEI